MFSKLILDDLYSGICVDIDLWVSDISFTYISSEKDVNLFYLGRLSTENLNLNT